VKIPVTVIVPIKNEALNLPRCLAALEPAERVLIIDSGSSDSSVQIAGQFNAEVVQFSYGGGYPKKRQWAIDNLEISTPWIFFVDADEVVPTELWAEISAKLSSNDSADAFFVRKEFHFMGRRFKFGGFSHTAVLLVRTGKGRFEELFDDVAGGLDMEVHERLVVNGTIGRLATSVVHEDFKGLEAYISRHNSYSTWEAAVRFKFLKSREYGKLTVPARLFGNPQEARRFLKLWVIRIPFESILWFLYHYFIRFGFLEGRPGLIASRIRSDYIHQVRAKMYEMDHVKSA